MNSIAPNYQIHTFILLQIIEHIWRMFEDTAWFEVAEAWKHTIHLIYKTRVLLQRVHRRRIILLDCVVTEQPSAAATRNCCFLTPMFALPDSCLTWPAPPSSRLVPASPVTASHVRGPSQGLVYTGFSVRGYGVGLLAFRTLLSPCLPHLLCFLRS
jgi:hypothetical protein